MTTHTVAPTASKLTNRLPSIAALVETVGMLSVAAIMALCINYML
ncbi:MAG: hypothetical protein PW843_12065 [Azospirillaceae bacterium]|nr:hypothetical protein [Azospirillaceae bacterium]